MPLEAIDVDIERCTITATGTYPVDAAALWRAWADPRLVERFWGPPEWPATFFRHDMFEGGRSEYAMRGPGGETAPGYWEVVSVEEGRRLVVVDGFATDDGAANPDLPAMRTELTCAPDSTGSRMTLVTYLPGSEALEQLRSMGVEAGLAAALGQLDAVLADPEAVRDPVTGPTTVVQLLDDRRMRISRVLRATVEDVWRAHHDPALLTRWLLGPDGWTMPRCEVATALGEHYHHEWASEDGSTRFGFEGELLELTAPRRSVTSERLAGTEGPATRNELTLRPAPGGTLLCLVITCPDGDVRDQMLQTGMADGMEASYARLERIVASTV